MAIGDHDVLARASRVLRAAPEPGWHAIEDRVLAAVRATPRGGWPIEVVDPEPDAHGRVRVSDLALKTLISQTVSADPDVTLVDVDVVLDGETLRAVRIDVSGRYRSDLPAAATRIRARALAVVEDTIGRDDVEVSVTVTDVHR